MKHLNLQTTVVALCLGLVPSMASAAETNAPPTPLPAHVAVETPATNALPATAATPPEPALQAAEILSSAATNAPVAATNSIPQDPPPLPPELVSAAAAGTNGLIMNFRGVPLDMVLDYLSEAAGFIIVLETPPRGRVDVWSNQPLTQDEAVALLNTVLQKNGYAAIRRGRTLTIINRDDAKTRAVPVKSGSDPAGIPDNDEIVTQIIPVRFVEASQLLKDLQPLISVQTPITANESGNSIIITDTQSNIRRVAEVIKAIDGGAEDITEVRVFKLQNADPAETAEFILSLFPEDSRSGSSGNQSPMRFGGFRDFFRGGGGPPGGGGDSQNSRIRRRTKVTAVADNRTASVAVTAAKDLMVQIEEVVNVLDENPAKRQTVKVFQLQNADPAEAMSVLQDIFQKNTRSNSRGGSQQSLLQNRSEQQGQQNMSGIGSTGRRSTGTRRTTGTR